MDATKNIHKNIDLENVTINGEQFFKISHVDRLRPFFMTIISSGNHWMFLSSNGGVTAGRKNSEYALFPYYTDDKITESAENTGSKTIIRIEENGCYSLWEPFSLRSERVFSICRNLYKNVVGNKIIFEEINHDLELSFSYEWNNSNLYGFVKKSTLTNLSDKPKKLSILDGFQNIIPYGIGSELQLRVSNLGDAYKRTELDEGSGLAIYALSSIIVDKAEPSEALKANTVFSIGLKDPKYLISSIQLDSFRNGEDLRQENDIKGERGAYFICEESITLGFNPKQWYFTANVNQSQSSIVSLIDEIQSEGLIEKLQKDIDTGTQEIIKLVTSADGVQYSEDIFKASRHFSNTAFNIMRGGIFDNNYIIERVDLEKFICNSNKDIFEENRALLRGLPNVFTIGQLTELASKSNNPDLIRLSTEYLPLKFSRRHGDPSRPWNKFSINTLNELDGSKILDYEGNWRDIFQNWESLAHSYPLFIQGMIFRFINASTFDGYNPYRITKDGFDWETIEKDDPWSYIGYWGDHQIIYLLKFLEFAENYFPNSISNLLNKRLFVYANIPYKIKSFEDILHNPKDTIDFDFDLDRVIRQRRDEIGSDGALLLDKNSQIVRVNFTEKLLATTLAKFSNFILEGGIWMNTQRPEWNDANNALVGNGVSVVTLCYLRRFMKYFKELLNNSTMTSTSLSKEMFEQFNSIYQTLQSNHSILSESISGEEKKRILSQLGTTASHFRNSVYYNGFSGEFNSISKDALVDFAQLALDYIDHSLKANQREDGLYHAYNLVTFNDDSLEINYLNEMLEGQVAILSSGYLTNSQSIKVLDALRRSSLYREDQMSYLLYPAKELKGFLSKNTFTENEVNSSYLLTQLVNDSNKQIIEKDIKGNYHFNGNLRNAKELEKALNNLDSKYKKLALVERKFVLNLYEKVFNHKSFTGRSGTFYGYEGLGSIYWHMVSKLALAVMECCIDSIEKEEKSLSIELLRHYREIEEGIGVHKSPSKYGAFPTDAYSHTPANKGAQQPGMTGQVKEDILCRFLELGLIVKSGKLRFYPYLINQTELSKSSKTVDLFSFDSTIKTLTINPGSVLFTKCQTPVVYEYGEKNELEITLVDGSRIILDDFELPEDISSDLFTRSGKLLIIKVIVKDEKL